MAHVTRVLREKLPKDAVLANDAGNFSGWAHRSLQLSRYPSQVGPTSGAMGYGVPAALGACVAAPERLVVCFPGGGGFLMRGNEIATALNHDLNPIGRPHVSTPVPNAHLVTRVPFDKKHITT